MDILKKIATSYTFFDGAMGTQLYKMGLKAGEKPEAWNLSNPSAITKIHKDYFLVGANIATANTFGANPLKLENCEELIFSAIKNAKNAIYKDEQYVALDIGPSGRLIKPLGDLDFEDAISAFATVARAGERAGADLILIETMSDPYELKAAVIASKENTSLPIFATFVLDENGKTLTGADASSMIALLEGLGVSAIGVNCSLGAKQLKRFIPEIVKNASVPVIVNPNAGLPSVIDGETSYDSTPEEFAENMAEIVAMGATVLGGCCGTTPEHIRLAREAALKVPFTPIAKKSITVASSYIDSVVFDNKCVIIGERINPTGKPKLKNALREGDIGYILNEAVIQEEKGARMLDVNVGLPEINEKEMLVKVVRELQSVTSLPLQLDTSSPEALESAMRIYNGKPLVNSVNGKKESMEAVFPIVKKYGGVVIALTLDENGIPASASERVKIAQKIIDRAREYGIDKKDIIVDPLCLTVSSDKNAPSVTLESIKMLKELGIKTSLGISNVSFGLPERDNVNAVFFAHALQNGLDAVIMNPSSVQMQRVFHAHNALIGIDEGCIDYIQFATSSKEISETEKTNEITLKEAIVKGLKGESEKLTKALIINTPPLEIVNNYIVSALDEVGEKYEKGTLFLPQLLQSAEAATVAFSVIRSAIPTDAQGKKGDIILATVKGDIHDIGKNIVKVILANYGYTVHDLGKDVTASAVLSYVEKTKISLVGLSALMTTTVPSMQETIELVKAKCPSTKFMVGGAVITSEYAKMIGADFYAKDAMDAVKIAKEVFKN